MRDRRFAPIFILILLGLGIVFFLQNATPTISLVFVGANLPALPLAAWLLLGAIAGFVTSLALGGLWRSGRRVSPASEKSPEPTSTPKQRPRKKTAKRKAAASSKRDRQPATQRSMENQPKEFDELDEPAPWDDWEEPQDTPINVEATATDRGKPRNQQLQTTGSNPTDESSVASEEDKELASETTEWLGEEFFEDWKQEIKPENEPADTGDPGKTSEVAPGKTYERYRQPVQQYRSGSVYSYTYTDPETTSIPETEDHQTDSEPETTSVPETATDQVPVESPSESPPAAEAEVAASSEDSRDRATRESTPQEPPTEAVSWEESLAELEIENRETETTASRRLEESSTDDLPEDETEGWQTGFPGSSPSAEPSQEPPPSKPAGLAKRFVQKIVSPNQSNPPKNQKPQDTRDIQQDDWEDDWETPSKKSDREDDW
jgi:hypothetical protein